MAIQVQTSHNVIIDYQPASVGWRILAFLIDAFFIFLWYVFCYFVALSFFYISIMDYFDDLTEWSLIVFIMFLVVPFVFYDLLFETLNKGQSPGKMICRIRVISLDGARPTFSAYLIRWLFRLVDMTLTNGLLAVLMVAINKKSQRLGDYLAGTTVIDLKLNRNNRELSITDLNFADTYTVTYPDVLELLTDGDMQAILAFVNDKSMYSNGFLTSRLINRIVTITGYQYNPNMPAEKFLRVIIDDYHYLATL